MLLDSTSWGMLVHAAIQCDASCCLATRARASSGVVKSVRAAMAAAANKLGAMLSVCVQYRAAMDRFDSLSFCERCLFFLLPFSSFSAEMPSLCLYLNVHLFFFFAADLHRW